MDNKLNKTIQWTIYILILFVFILGFILPFSIFLLSNNPSNRVINWMNYAGIGLSILSIALAVFSIYSSNRSQERLESALSKIKDIQQDSDTLLHEVKIHVQTIQQSQDRMETHLSTIRTISESAAGMDHSVWKKDETGPNA